MLCGGSILDGAKSEDLIVEANQEAIVRSAQLYITVRGYNKRGVPFTNGAARIGMALEGLKFLSTDSFMRVAEAPVDSIAQSMLNTVALL